MSQNDLHQKLQELLTHPFESEIFECKEAKNDFDFGKLGKYFSALANEANLCGAKEAWLVFGIRDRDRVIVGSQFKNQANALTKLKSDISHKTTNRITFKDIHTLDLPEGRVLMFQIPAAPKGLPIAWEDHYYGRNGEELVALNLEKIDRIRAQATAEDWSAQICPQATIADLDPQALAKARENYLEKYPAKASEIKEWDEQTFLNKAKITVKGKISRTAIILLGRTEAEHFINPAEAKIRWILRNSRGEDVDYLLESCPLLLAVDKIYAKIRNTTYRYIKGESLFPDEVIRYEPYLIREAINNCIAHQDYSLGGRINVVELEDQLVFSNKGSFLPGSVERVVIENAPEEYYRNQFLVTAMFNLGMVDTMGGGIRKMFMAQSRRFFPMPEYDIEPDRVKMTVTGKVLDMDFAQTLIRNPELSLQDIMLLDKVQKKKPLTKHESQYLKSRGFVEGKSPNYVISASVIEPTFDTDLRANYIRQRGFNDDHYKKMILEYIQKFGSASRRDIDILLLNKLPEVLSAEQKKVKVGNLIYALRMAKQIENKGSDAKPIWTLLVSSTDL
ncbi:MAG: putative DNA binding domain-containing protein [Saprospiraceae bacterium]|nr:putative DNA binding domain-containing protein [Saprospiraceae bacterium]